MSRSVLVTGATGIVGTELLEHLRNDHRLDVAGVSSRGDASAGVLAWRIGSEPVPAEVRRPWDAIIHTAASTRWTMTVDEAHAANVRPLEQLASLAAQATHFVHVSTAYATGLAGGGASQDPADYRNPYEWSKAVAEQRLRDLLPSSTIVRPALIIGRRSDGVIARFSGTYSLLHALTSGLAGALVGDRRARIEIVPVDDVCRAIVDALDEPPASGTRLEILASGAEAPTFEDLVTTGCSVLNEFRASREVPPLDVPPFIDVERWERFFLPFGREFMRPLQLRVISVLREFQAYTTSSHEIAGTRIVPAPLGAFEQSVRYWTRRNERSALRIPLEWSA